MLLCAAFVWGMSFPAQTAASEVVGPFTFIAGKSSIACLFALGMIAFRRLARRGEVERGGAEDGRCGRRRAA